MKNATLVGTMNSVPLGFSYLYLKESSRFALTFFDGVMLIFSTLDVSKGRTVGTDDCVPLISRRTAYQNNVHFLATQLAICANFHVLKRSRYSAIITANEIMKSEKS